MRGQVADTRFMFARLYTNAALRPWTNDLRDQLLNAAIIYLSGEENYDAIRREFNAGSSVLEVTGRQARTDPEKPAHLRTGA